jgi:hypothetical protein
MEYHLKLNIIVQVHAENFVIVLTAVAGSDDSIPKCQLSKAQSQAEVLVKEE